MPGGFEVVSPHAVSLVFLFVALVAVQTPVYPVQIELLHESHQVSPGGTPIVVSKLAQNKGHCRLAQYGAHEQLLVEYFFTEPLLANCIPQNKWAPRKPIEVSTVNQLFFGLQADRMLQDRPEVQLVIQPAYNNEHVGCPLVYSVGDSLSSQFPVEGGTISPGWLAGRGWTNLVPEVDADDPVVLGKLSGQVLEAGEKLVFWVVLVEPQAILVVIAAAPLGLTGVVVQDYHQSSIGELIYCVCEYFLGGFAVEMLVGGEEEGVYEFVLALPLSEQLEGEGEANAVHAKHLFDVVDQIAKRTPVQSPHAVPGCVATRPIPSRYFHSAPFAIYYRHAAS